MRLLQEIVKHQSSSILCFSGSVVCTLRDVLPVLTGPSLLGHKSGSRAVPTGPSHALAAHSNAWAATSQQAAAAHGKVSLQGANNSYNAHPATLDASLHLGACLAATDSGRVTVRVPSALAAFWADRNNPAQSWATAGDASLQPGDSALSSYWLASPGGIPGSSSMRELLAKPLTRAPSAASENAALPRANMLYTLHWKATEAAQSGPLSTVRPRPLRRTLNWRTTGHPADSLLLGGSGPEKASMASLARIQQVLTGHTGRSAGLQLRASSLITSGPGKPGRLNDAVTAGGASGLLRTAAQESPALKWQVYATSAFASRPFTFAEAAAGADAFGMHATDGVAFLPQLLPTKPTSTAAGVAPFSGHAGSILISGGLGDIGAMLAAWAGHNLGLHVHLLGRTGHVQLALRAAVAGLPHVTVTRCDVASAEETRALTPGGPLRQIWHAGGLLQDGTLPKQTAAMMRAVAAPKLPGAQNLAAAAAGSPLEHVALFSSTAALLGPAGQGNYAAANAQLNAWAQHTQATGDCSVFLADWCFSTWCQRIKDQEPGQSIVTPGAQ